ncbi:MAG: hypothetical protein ABL878_04395 [Burkholderiales bacterium]
MGEGRVMRGFVAGGFFLLLGARILVSGADLSEAELKQDAVSRLVKAQDPSLSVNIGRVYVKQAALSAARTLLFEKGRSARLKKERWNLNHPEWQAAEGKLVEGTNALIRREVDNPQWVRRAWSEMASTLLNGEEADEIAVHFESGGGQLQRRVIEWYVGELTLQTYTFTDRLKYGVPGSEREMEELRKTTYEIRSHFDPIYDLTKYPNAMRFASRDPGVKYFKMMVMQGVHAVHVHLEKAASQVRQTVLSRAALVDPHIARVLAEVARQ